MSNCIGKYLIHSGHKIDGELTVQSAKNSFLPILAACLISDGEVVLHKVPNIIDVDYMTKIVENLGVKIVKYNDDLLVDSRHANTYEISSILTKEIRSSIFLLGAVLARFRQVKISYPGGCDIGNRPIDLHIKGLKALNVKVTEKHGYIICDGENMKPNTIHLDFPSVGATENLMMVATKINGITKIVNPAKEPEIVDLQNFLNASGCKISGAGTSVIYIEGVDKTNGCEYTPIPDRIATGTYIIATAMTGGKLLLKNTYPEHIESLISKLKLAGCDVSIKDNEIFTKANGRMKSIQNIDTQPYPGFPTDLQSQVMSLQTISDGVSIICENLFENRFKNAAELNKMGADIVIRDRMAIIKGVNKLYGADVQAHDLRGGAALVLAGLVAEGVTTVSGIHHIYRGYENFENNLTSLGLDIKKIEENTTF